MGFNTATYTPWGMQAEGAAQAAYAQARSTNQEVDLIKAQTASTTAQTAMRKKILDQLLGRLAPQVQANGQVGGPETSSMLSQLDSYGQGEKAVINEGFANAQGTAMARLTGRGLGGSSGVASALGGIERQKQLTLGVLGDKLIDRKISVQESALNRQTQMQSLLASLLG